MQNEHSLSRLLSLRNDDTLRPSHVFICVPEADEMKWTCIYVCKRNEGVQLSHTHTHTWIHASFHLTTHTVSNKGKREFFLLRNLSFSLVSFSLSFSSELIFIRSSVMPSWCAYNFLLQFLIILIVYCAEVLSRNDNHHQLLNMQSIVTWSKL